MSRSRILISRAFVSSISSTESRSASAMPIMPGVFFRAGAAVALLRAAVDEARQGQPFLTYQRAHALWDPWNLCAKRT